MEGEYAIKAGDELLHCKAGDSVLVPRGLAHAFAKVNEGSGILLTLFQPAGRMEEFFRERRERGSFANQQEEQVLWRAYGMEILGPPLPTE
ncbi:cupin domain-containing protein [Spirosoma sp. KNUC1025]|uniref:cupin domain-containing protein n=1 Tax=Spirosoma sp. KNUC1025 TaxID=2894082 RepID=UPI00386814D3